MNSRIGRKGARMAVELIDGSIFLHIPKTGGTWVTEVLADCGLIKRKFAHKHLDAARLSLADRVADGKDLLRELIWPKFKRKIVRGLGFQAPEPPFLPQGRFCFMFVRNPLKWYESYWRYSVGLHWRAFDTADNPFQWHPLDDLRNLRNDDFNEYVRGIARKHPGFVAYLYGLYHAPQVRFVGRQESLVDDLVAVLRTLDLPFDEQFVRSRKPINVSRVSETAAVWDPELKREVERLEYAAFARYGYTESPSSMGGALRKSRLSFGSGEHKAAMAS